MKTTLLSLIAFALFSVSAAADTLVIDKHSSRDLFAKGAFQFNDAGRSWVRLTYQRETYNPRVGEMYYRPFSKTVNVAGLSYDKASAKIQFVTQAGAKVVCATVAPGKNWLGKPIWLITPTGACKIQGSDRSRLVRFIAE